MKRSLVYSVALFALSCTIAFAQNVTYSSSDLISPATAGGNPASSYALSGLDQVNLYNGHLNVTIPLLRVGGRGTAGYTMQLPIQKNWAVDQVEQAGTNYASSAPVLPTFYSTFSYAPGMLTITSASAQPYGCYDDLTHRGWYDVGPYVTRVMWTGSDGTQTTLLDATYGGQPQGTFPNNGSACGLAYSYQPVDRGRVFRSSDGSGVVFTSNHDVQDSNGLSGGSGDYSGVLSFRDGTRYTINGQGAVVQIEDKNGNLIQLSYPVSNAGYQDSILITDSLNRTIQVHSTPSQDTITYPGANNATHTIVVNHSLMGAALDISTGQSQQTYNCLFPELGGSSRTSFDPPVISSVNLPDGTAYTLSYNSYGEVSRLGLPTGGAYRYFFTQVQSCTGGGSGVLAGFPYTGYSIYRRLQERDELADGGNISSKVVYSAQPTSNVDSNHPGRSETVVTADHRDANNNFLKREVHYFYGDPTSPSSVPSDPTKSQPWSDGMEFRSEISDIPNGNIKTWSTTQNVYGQRPCGQGENCWFGDPQADSAPLHDQHLCQTNTTLENGEMAGVVSAFDDQYNNPTDKF